MKDGWSDCLKAIQLSFKDYKDKKNLFKGRQKAAYFSKENIEQRADIHSFSTIFKNTCLKQPMSPLGYKNHQEVSCGSYPLG